MSAWKTKKKKAMPTETGSKNQQQYLMQNKF